MRTCTKIDYPTKFTNMCTDCKSQGIFIFFSLFFPPSCYFIFLIYDIVSQPPGRGPVPGPGINYTGPREILLELITNLNVILYLST